MGRRAGDGVGEDVSRDDSVLPARHRNAMLCCTTGTDQSRFTLLVSSQEPLVRFDEGRIRRHEQKTRRCI
jgi:hypothetical protein